MDRAGLIYLSAGSNLGDRRANLSAAIDALHAAGLHEVQVSSIYETEPLGVPSQPWFLNIAIKSATSLPPRDLLECCLRIESERGRSRPFPGAPRVLDLDILLYGQLIIDEPFLQIPHPRMALRRFVLQPLAQIAPEAFHPVLQATIRDLLAVCPDHSRVAFHSEMP